MIRRRVALALLIVGCVAITAAFPLAANYERSVANVLVSEGCEYENHPADPGGPTKCGITLADVRTYLKPNATAADVRALTEIQARAIYRTHYWDHRCVRGDELRRGLDYLVFDYAVNAGTDRVGKRLRALLGLKDADCAIDATVLAAIDKRGNAATIMMLSAERRSFYLALVERRPSMRVFLAGWLSREERTRVIALRMAGPVTARPIELDPAYGPGKAYEVEEPQP
jgi:lysozyme family protein